MVAPFEERQLQHAAGARHFRSNLAQERDRRRQRAARRQQIVEHDDALSGPHGIGLDLQRILPASTSGLKRAMARASCDTASCQACGCASRVEMS